MQFHRKIGECGLSSLGCAFRNFPYLSLMAVQILSPIVLQNFKTCRDGQKWGWRKGFFFFFEKDDAWGKEECVLRKFSNLLMRVLRKGLIRH